MKFVACLIFSSMMVAMATAQFGLPDLGALEPGTLPSPPDFPLVDGLLAELVLSILSGILPLDGECPSFLPSLFSSFFTSSHMSK